MHGARIGGAPEKRASREARHREKAKGEESGKRDHVRDHGERNQQDADQRDDQSEHDDQQRGNRRELRQHADPEGPRELQSQHAHDAIEVLLGEQQDADADHHQHGEPSHHHLERSPRGRGLGRGPAPPRARENAAGDPANRPHIPFHDAAYRAHPAIDGDGIPADGSAGVYDDIAVHRDRIAGHPTADGQISARHRHGARLCGTRWDFLIAQFEAVGVRSVNAPEQAANEQDFGAKPSVHCRRRAPRGINGLLGRRCHRKGRRGQRAISERAHGQLRARLEVAMSRSPRTVAMDATRNPPAASAMPRGPTC